jgi:cytochrome P450
MNVRTEVRQNLPSHVPPELYWDHDITKFAAQFEDPYVGVSSLFDGPDIIWAKAAFRGRPSWVFTRFAHIEEAFRDHANFSNRDSSDARNSLGVDWSPNPLEIDPPAHMGYRLILQPYFQPGHVNELEPMARQICRELIGKFEHKGTCEFISEFASAFPSYIFLEMMGMPREKLPEFMHWEDQFFRGADETTRASGAQSVMNYMDEFSKARQAHPTDDLVSKIVTARLDGRLLNYGEIMGMCVLLFFGALDTVLSSLGWYFRHLARDPALQARLRANPGQVPAAVDELLRAYGVTQTRRRVTRDFEFHGVTLKEGDWVVLPTYLAGRDPRQFANPHVIDIDRKARHLTFGSGVHNCLGIHLVRREIKVVLEEFISRFANIRITEGDTVTWHTDPVWGVSRLPLSWDR